MHIAKGLIYLFILGLVFGMVVIPTYIMISGLDFWVSLAAVAPGWFVGMLKLMPGIAFFGLLYGVYKHFADKKDRPDGQGPYAE
jgi:hypothetical protein